MPRVTTITVREVDQGRVVAKDAATGVTADGSNVPLAVSLLGEKLEIELQQ